MIHPDKNNCCGCGICAHICGHSAIDMETDELGFHIARINTAKCVDCGLCEKVCPFNDVKNNSNPLPIAYAIRHKKNEVVEESRSGGFFTALTDSILQEGGIVYGAALGAGLRVEHQRAETPAERNRFRGSKYSQSQLDDICISVRRDLREGKKVLFSGTPCQVAAIERFVGKRLTSNLFLVDVICHGVGSPAVWGKYIAQIEKSEKQKVVFADFRDKKKYGWDGLHKESFIIKGNPVRKYYPYIYYSDLHIMESCQNCPYTCIPRHSDITLGDLWGAEKVVPEWAKSNNGISLALINTDKGNKLFELCKKDVDYRTTELSDVMQPHLKHPIRFDQAKRKEYLEAFCTIPFETVLKKYHQIHRPNVWSIIRNKFKMMISK